MSDINFVETLCSICEKTKDIPQDDQLSYIRREITEINKSLPANIYIPFLKESIRNYVICHIPVTEIKIFRTKNRAPYMITVEVIRIDEINQFLLKKEREERKKFFKAHNIYYDRNENLDYLPEEEMEKFRVHSMTTSNLSNKKFRFKKKFDKKSFDHSYVNPRSNFSTFVETENETRRKRSTTLMMLAESDIKLSKPLIISNLETEIKRAPLRGEKKIILEENEDFEESSIKEDMNDIVKRRLTLFPIGKNKNKDKTSSLIEENPFSKFNKTNNKTNLDNEVDFVQRSRNFTTSEFRREGKFNLNLDKCDNHEENFYNQNIQIIPSRNSENNSVKEARIETASSDINDKKFENVFGETIEEQAERVKKFSPFGQFTTWQIFKMISKY